jgi:serine/threonine protein phosphatase 1
MGFMVGKGQGISGADHFWFGHTPVDRRYDFNNLHYIDTGPSLTVTLRWRSCSNK